MKRQTYLEELAEQMGPRTAIGRQVARKRARAAAKPKRPATLPPELTAPLDAKPGLVVGDGMMAKATAMLARANAGQRTPTPFDLAPAHWHPPGVVPPNTKLAMDEAVVGFSDWAAGAWGQNVVQSMFWEGQEFLGYPYLSVLGQRAEYRAIVETIATESMRKGYKVQAADPELDKTDRIRELTDYMANHLKVQEHFKLASAQDGYFGRAHLFIDTGESDDRDEMRLPIGDGNDALSRGKVTPKLQKTLALRNIEPVWCYPNNYNSNDPFKADWYNPQTWYGLGKETHKTRLLLFVGNPVSDLLKPAYSFGGLSMTQMAKPYVDNWLRIRQSIADIVQAFSVMVLSTDLSASLATDGQAMIQRAVVFNALRANNGLFMVNKDTEEFTNVAAPLGTLDQLQAQAQEHMCAVSKIPTVKLLGIQPAGLNADSEGIMRAFYDSIAAYQESFHRPNMTKVFHFAQLALWGEVDEALVLVFDPLFTLDEKGKAEVEKIELETDVIGVDSGILHPEEARKRIASNPDSPYQGLDVENVPEPPAEPGTEGEGGGTPEEGGGELEPTKVKSSINVAGGDEGVAEDGVLPFDASTEFVESEHPRSPDGKFGSGGGALKMADLKKVGKQMGSNPGGVYEDAAGKKFYVKQGQTKAHVDNELAAARLYRMASVPTLQYRPVEGGAHIATEMAKLDKDNAKKLSPAEVKEAQRDFAVHAWLSNWDVVGLGGDNLGVVGGKPTPLDMGGALAFRAQGSPKGGKFGDTVGEVDTLRSKQMNPDAAGVFGSMSEKDMRESARRVTDIPDEEIRRAAGDAALGDKLVARKRDLAKRFNLAADEAPFEEGKHPRDPDGKFSSGGGAAPALKHFKASPNKAEHQHAVHKITTSPAKKSHTYRWTLNKYIEEAKAFGAATQPLKDKLAQSWGLVLMDLQAKGDDATAKKVLKKIIDLKGAQAAAEQLKTSSPKPVEQPKPAPPPAQMTLAEQVKKFSPKFSAAVAAIPPPYETLDYAKNVVKAAVQQGDATVEAVNAVLTDKEKNLLAKQYGSVEKTYEKAQAYHAAKQEQEKSQAEQQAKAQAAAKVEADKLAAEMNDPAVKAHYDTLKGIGIGKYAKGILEAAQATIKKHNLPITPHEGAYIKAYVGSAYTELNEQLRDNVLTPEQWKYAAALDDAIDKMPKYEGDVVRGVSFKSSADWDRYVKAVGKVTREPAFTSAGVQSKLWGDHTFKIKSKNARDLRSFNPGEGGGEVLFKTNTAFRILKVEGNTCWMEEV